nr:prolyl aminopeptidase (EC 3.4.11.5) - Bacillus coagulans [Heyndrickxia coagulans]
MYTEGFIDVTGGRVSFQKFDENGGGTPVIVLHGGPGSSCYSLLGLKALAKDRPVILYDQLGCGKSDRPMDTTLWRLDRFVEELAQIRQALNLDEVHISVTPGDYARSCLLLNEAKRVKSVIFSSPCLSAPLWEQDQKRNLKKLPLDVQETINRCEENGTTDSEEFAAAIEVFGKHFVNRLEKQPEWLEQKPSGYRNADIYNIMWGPSEFTVLGNLKNFDCTTQLKEITCPSLYTCGRFDEATPETTEYYSSLTPKSKFHVFEKSAHMPYIEEPEEYLAVIGDFLNSI